MATKRSTQKDEQEKKGPGTEAEKAATQEKGVGRRPPRDSDARQPNRSTQASVADREDQDTTREINADDSEPQPLTNDENLVLEEDKDRVDYPSEEHDREVDKQRADLEPVAGEDSMPRQQTMVFSGSDADGQDAFIPAPALQVVTQMRAREDGTAMTGHFVEVTGGEHEGRYGVLDYITAVDKYGNPLTGLVWTRDNDAMAIVVDYKDLVPAEAGRR